MDTRFWGPSGWFLFHLIAAAPTHQHYDAVKQWFTLMEFVLPCKFCRASFHDYLLLQPLTDEIVRNRELFSRWMYDIHNRVNDKLRGQGLITSVNPTWKSVRSKYFTLQKTLCTSPFIGWDFITSIAYSIPDSTYKPIPFNDTPSDYKTIVSNSDKNRYNLLTRSERITKLRSWLNLIPNILPCQEWQTAWKTAILTTGHPQSLSRDAMMTWMWKIEKGVCTNLQCPIPHPSQPIMEHEVSAFVSNCSSTHARNAVTCRTRRHTRRSQVHKQRMMRISSLSLRNRFLDNAVS